MTDDILLNQAEELVDAGWDAIDVGDDKLAMVKAREALSLNAFALDAYVILARLNEIPTIRIALLREAVRQGQIQLTPLLKDYRQAEFWLELGTRPYMRAVHFLAVELWERNLADDREQAIAHARHLLKINPNDNQGIRFLAYGWYPALGMWDELTRLLRRYSKEARTETRYSYALDAFRRGDPLADRKLAEACAINCHVPAFLLARKAPFPLMADTVAYRSQDEAQAYAAQTHAVWQSVPGAIDWLAEHIRRKPVSGT